MSRRKRQKEAAADLRNAILLGVLGFLILGAIGYAGYWVYSKEEKIDELTLCPAAGPKAIHAFLFDQTDPITRQQAAQVKQHIERLIDQAKVGERFDLFTIRADSKSVLNADLQMCNPGNGNEANELYQNPRLIRETFNRKFLQPLLVKVDELLVETSRSSSPILESLKAAAITSFGRFERGQIPLRLTIVSDMIQYSADYSHYRNPANFSELRSMPAWPALRPNLKGAEVRILYIVRPTARRGNQQIQDRGHQLFWERVIFESEGKTDSFDLL